MFRAINLVNVPGLTPKLVAARDAARRTASFMRLRLLILFLADAALGLRVAPLSRPRASAAMTLTNADRRNFLSQAAAVSGLCLADLSGLPAFAADRRPVLVLGASGGTGRECVNYLLAQGRPCIAATRTGAFDAPSSPLLTVVQGDVTSAASLGALITPEARLGAVVYAASASRQPDAKGASNAKAVDRDGVIACAKLCIASAVPRMVLVSSGGVSKPTSAVYLFLNVAAGGIMDAKISGENEMRR